jgi:hypothetical protein
MIEKYSYFSLDKGWTNKSADLNIIKDKSYRKDRFEKEKNLDSRR